MIGEGQLKMAPGKEEGDGKIHWRFVRAAVPASHCGACCKKMGVYSYSHLLFSDEPITKET